MVKSIGAPLVAALMAFNMVTPLQAQTAPPSPTVFDNVRIFDGTALTAPMNVLVEGNQIARISAEPIVTIATAIRVAGGGRTLMPGLIDAHWHTFMARPSMALAAAAPFSFITLLAGPKPRQRCCAALPAFATWAARHSGLKSAIDAGVVAGPRIWPSGAMISQTGGHGISACCQRYPRPPTI